MTQSILIDKIVMIVRTVAATTASTTSPSTTEVALNDLTKQMSDLCKIFANNGPRIANGGMA
jgi:hypothetical protein